MRRSFAKQQQKNKIKTTKMRKKKTPVCDGGYPQNIGRIL